MKVVHLICACRPNFMKVAPLYHALKKTDWCQPEIVHIRQHADAVMSVDFLREFSLPVEAIFSSYEDALTYYEKPAATIVPGDVRASRAAALTAVDAGIPVVHLEAGLRSFDRSMPEEINRIVIDAVSSVWWTPSIREDQNLEAEGFSDNERVGNVMIDTLEMLRPQIEHNRTVRLAAYAVATFHRPSNVDSRKRLTELVDQLIQMPLHTILPAHPRTYRRLKEFMLLHRLRESGVVDVIEPQPYTEFMRLVMGATIVITDSGGVQEETSYLGIPCATVRENTERPITVSHGTNVLIRPDQIVETAHDALRGGWKPWRTPIPLWDGHTADRCVESLKRFLLPQRGIEHE